MLLIVGSFIFSFSQETEAARVTNQNVTAYVGDGKTASGTTPIRYYSVAVHPKQYSSLPPIAVNSGPRIPYGSTIVTEQEIWMPGHLNGWDDTFRVEDLGDLNNSRGLTTLWFDIFFGTDTPSNRVNAISFGKKSGINYNYY